MNLSAASTRRLNMKTTKTFLFLAATLQMAFASAASAQGGFIEPASQELITTILAKDKQLFDAVFEKCDTAALASLVADDFEFYHDKHGQAFNTGSAWVKAMAQTCVRQEQGIDYRARRELDLESSKVYPMKNYGAIHNGLHRFYKKLPDGKEQLVEVSLFTNLWKYGNGSWKLTRVFSYDHRDAR
jgi:hypothetical protein